MTTNHDVVTLTLKVLARHFDERHEARAKLAADAREDEPTEFPEQDAIARTWKNAADATWELVGGRPGADDSGQRSIRIGLRELGKLVEMATHPLCVAHAPVAAPQPLENLGRFDDTLVDHLSKKALVSPDGVRLILTELASMPCELPTADELVHAWFGRHIFKGDAVYDQMHERGTQLREFVGSRVAPVLAAKDATVAQYDEERNRNARIVAAVHDAIVESKHLALHKGDENALVTAIKDADTRIADLEAAQRDDARRHAKELSDCDAATARIAELEKRLSVPTVDGKTPGEVFAAEFLTGGESAVPKLGNETLAKMNNGALAVLRAFGGAALRKVRERLLVPIARMNDEPIFPENIAFAEAQRIIDDEIANLTSANPDGVKP